MIQRSTMAVHPSCRCPDLADSRNLKVGLATKKGNRGDASQHPEAVDTGEPARAHPAQGSVDRPRACLWMKRCLISSPLPAVCRSGACTVTSVMFRYRAQLYSAALRLTRSGSRCRRSAVLPWTGQVADRTANALRNTRAYSPRSCYPLLVLHNCGQKERPGFSTFRGSRAALIDW